MCGLRGAKVTIPSLHVRRRLTATVRGRVQGIGFRMHVLAQARCLGLRGWVRNRASGEVEVVAEGQSEPLRVLLAALRRGPSGAYVTDVDMDLSPATGEFPDFRIRHDEW